MGWPIIGETLEFSLACQGGNPGRFLNDRMNKYSPQVFKTSLLEANMAVMCGASGNKFLFSNEDKLVVSWWQRSMKKILCFPSVFNETLTGDKFRPPTFLPEFLKPEALQHYLATMDSMASEHIELNWSSNREVLVFPLARKYSFALAFRLFMSIDDPEYVEMISHPFQILNEGFLSVPIDIPGTTFNRALKASKFIHNELLAIIRKRKMELEQKGDSAARDLLSHMLLASDENCDVKSEMEISTQVICLLFATHHTTSSVITFILKYLAEFPDVYSKVLKDEIYLECANETMRLTPPVQGTFREAITDITYAGFTIPRGWKMHWNVNTTHRDPKYFPDPEKFNPSRFEGKGPQPFTFVPFGGGPRMCPGREYARAQVLAFIHHVVTRFKWEKVDPCEKVAYNPSPIPSKGFPIRLQPLQNGSI
ncbi:Beta-amyrin 28-oxidase [Vitis vinifera]|uniref:Beta-amyrin 28-oxidase n=1 Tax=Vitis vinifera TaxID=29760 RepID=A0A438FSG7_VITVI|nr:Beta-amyrin 28-oxidase [Vitis vinifera]